MKSLTLSAAALMMVLPMAAISQVTQEVSAATGARLRALDKVSGETVDLDLATGEVGAYGRLRVELEECRYPTEDPSSNAFALLYITEEGKRDAQFSGWMVAGSPALNALDHPRYDVWVLRCRTSSGESSN